jgi:hypothetical protein
MTTSASTTMSDVFRCCYCGATAPLRQATVMWRFLADLNNDDDELYAVDVFCSSYCGRRAAYTEVAIGT